MSVWTFDVLTFALGFYKDEARDLVQREDFPVRLEPSHASLQGCPYRDRFSQDEWRALVRTKGDFVSRNLRNK